MTRQQMIDAAACGLRLYRRDLVFKGVADAAVDEAVLAEADAIRRRRNGEREAARASQFEAMEGLRHD